MMDFTQKNINMRKTFRILKIKNIKILHVRLLFIAGVFCMRSFSILFVILISNLKNKGGIKNDEKI